MTGGSDAVEFLGVPFARCDLDEALRWVEAAAQGDDFAYVVTPNVDHLVLLNEDGEERWRAEYRQAVAESDLCVNDSRVLARLARLSGKRLDLVPGSDLVRRLVARAEERLGAIALIGGNAREAEWLERTLPGSRVAHFSPPMGVREDPDAQHEIAEFVERERADCVLMAIGAPQSELVCLLLKRRGRARGVALCIGASVEFLSGAQTRAPRWMQKAGLEWLFRLLSDPRRLWRRYLVRGPRIFALWAKARRASRAAGQAAR